MRHLFFYLFFAFSVISTGFANAQQSAWIQIESQPSLREGQNRARAYAGVFDNVSGFSVASGWYAVTLGPFTPAAAERRMGQLQRENLIPYDSFIADGQAFRQQFWPIGANTRNATPVEPQSNLPEVTPVVVAPPVPADETPRQARASEAELTRDERKELQSALQWEGFYTSAIDGAFGRGTRGAMSAYQESLGYEPTGVLTSKQRFDLIASYNTVLEGLGLTFVQDAAAGIEIDMPKALVAFSRFEPPFVHYDAKGDAGVRVLLISQTGDQSTLFGLYDIMQTLEIVPMEGARERGDKDFTLTGQDDKIHSHTYATLKDGMVKGFTLVWPAGDEKRRKRVVDTMMASFTAFGDTALDPNLGEPSPDQSIDLLAGLEIRRPMLSRSGFYLDAGGLVLTTFEAVQGCARITIDEVYEAEVSFADAGLGIALLQPLESLAPSGHANFRSALPRLKSEVAVAGYSYEGALGAPTMSFGTLADIRGLKGETELRRLALAAQPGDAGGPVFDMTGSVLGMLLPRPDEGGQRLPEGVNFAISAEAMGAVLAENGVVISASQPTGAMAPEDLTALAIDMTVLVGCWN